MFLIFCLAAVGFVRGETEPSPLVSMVTETTTTAPIEPAIIEPDLPVQNPQPRVATTESSATELSPSPRRFHYSVAFDFRIAYDDNITLSNTDPIDDLYGRIEAILDIGVGDFEGRQENFLKLNYAPSYYFYSENSSFDDFEHLARLDALYRFTRLTLTAVADLQSVQSSHLESRGITATSINASNLDVGARKRITTYFSRLNAAYDVGGKTSMSAGIDYTLSNAEDLINSQAISAVLALDYKLTPKVGIGISGSAGKNLVDDPSPDQSFQQINGRMSYDATGKVSANASAGVEFRQFDNGTDDHVSPVFQFGLNYHPFDGTTITVNAARQTLNSAVLSNQDYASTQFTGSVRQRLFQRVFVTVTGGYQNLDYFSTSDGSSTAREDNYYFIQPDIDVTVTRYWSIGAFYVHRMDESTINLFGFDENQFGIYSKITF